MSIPRVRCGDVADQRESGEEKGNICTLENGSDENTIR